VSAFAAGEHRHHTEPEYACPRCGRPVTVWDDLCAGCEDDAHDHAQDQAQQRDDRAAAHGRDHA
jgi:predicted amidophosphoribosyltransferase